MRFNAKTLAALVQLATGFAALLGAIGWLPISSDTIEWLLGFNAIGAGIYSGARSQDHYTPHPPRDPATGLPQAYVDRR